MRIIQLRVFLGALKDHPLGYRPGMSKHFMARIWSSPSSPGGLGREWLVTRGPGGPYLLDQLPHGEPLEYGMEGSGERGTWKARWYGVLLAPDGVGIDAEQARFIHCDTADEALRLASAIQSGDRRARAYLPGGPALAPDLQLPRELPAADLSMFAPLDHPAPRRGEDPEVVVTHPAAREAVEMLPTPPKTASGRQYVGCITEAQVKAVYARARNGCGLTKAELYDLCKREFRVSEVKQLRPAMFRPMMDVVLPANAKPGYDPSKYREKTPAEKFHEEVAEQERRAK